MQTLKLANLALRFLLELCLLAALGAWGFSVGGALLVRVLLAAALAPGGRLYLLGFAMTFPCPIAPRHVREDELRALFSAERGWRVLALRAAQFESRSPMGQVPAVAGGFERAAT